MLLNSSILFSFVTAIAAIAFVLYTLIAKNVPQWRRFMFLLAAIFILARDIPKLWNYFFSSPDYLINIFHHLTNFGSFFNGCAVGVLLATVIALHMGANKNIDK